MLALGFFVITRHEFNMTSIAAILTIVGYSLNETVVVFDRTRELMRRYKSIPTEELLNLSINSTMSRTVMTATDRVPVASRAGALRRAGDRRFRSGHAMRRRDLHLLGDLHLDSGADLLGLRAGARDPTEKAALPQAAE